MDGNASRNIDALDTLVRAMHKYGVGYGSINHPVDGCLECGYHGIIDNECPTCGNQDESKIERIRRITGYLFEELKKDSHHHAMLAQVDVLVDDGRFELSIRDLSLYYKGSSNQRIINVAKSLGRGDIMLELE